MAEGCQPERKGLPTTEYQAAGELLKMLWHPGLKIQSDVDHY